MNDYLISTKRLHLRTWLEKDLEPFAKMNADKEVMQYFPRTYSRDETSEMMERIKSLFTQKGFGLYVVEDKLTAAFMGFTGFAIPSFESYFTPCVEIGWRFHKAYWGNGFATEAALACLSHGFTQLGFRKIYSFTSSLNIPSENVMKRIGMMKQGEFDHPKIESSHHLCKHVLYSIEKP